MLAKSKIISFIGWFYLAVGSLYLLTLPITIWVTISKHNLKYGIIAFVFGILPIGILSISSIFFAKELLELKERGRKGLLILSGIYAIYGLVNLLLTFTSRGFHSPIGFNLVLVTVSLFAFCHLKKQGVRPRNRGCF